MCELTVASVVNAADGEALTFGEQHPEGAFGSTLAISLPNSCSKKYGIVISCTYSECDFLNHFCIMQRSRCEGNDHL